MTEGGYLIIAVCVIVALALTFIASFVLYTRTPAPKGCEDIKINVENCSSCGKTDCSRYTGKKEGDGK